MPRPAYMHGGVLIGRGGPEKLQWCEDLPVPCPAKGSVVIRVRAAGVKNTDLNTRVGWYSKGDTTAADANWGGTPLSLPRIQGIDVCGHIAAFDDGMDPPASASAS